MIGYRPQPPPPPPPPPASPPYELPKWGDNDSPRYHPGAQSPTASPARKPSRKLPGKIQEMWPIPNASQTPLVTFTPENIKTIIQDCFGTSMLTFPGSHPVSLTRAHLENFGSHKSYCMCEKTDGVRMLMCVCVWQTYKLTFLVNRRMEFVHIHVHHVPRTLYAGTIYDGELAWDMVNKRYAYLIYDALKVEGDDVRGLPTLRERLDRVRKSLQVYHYDELRDALSIEVKTHIDLFDKQKSAAFLSAFSAVYDKKQLKPESYCEGRLLRFKMDGLVFQPAESVVQAGRTWTLFKWKPTSELTIDAEVDRNRKLCVYDSEHQTMVQINGSCSTKFKVGDVVECKPKLSASNAVTWLPVKARTDKCRANDMVTFRGTVAVIHENITLAQICEALG